MPWRSGEGTQTLPMTLLKRLISRLPPAERRALTGYLQTIYAENMVTQGHLSVALDKAAAVMRFASTPRQVETMEHFYENVSDALESIQNLSDLTGELAWLSWELPPPSTSA